MLLEERTRIEAEPAEVYRFFEEMEAHYVEWHPDHISFRWVDGDGLHQGVTAYFEERIAGALQRKTVQFTTVEPDRYIEFRPTGWTRFLLPHISFTIEPAGEGSLVTQRIKVRTGPIGAWLNRREFDAVRQHMREEGENLDRLLRSQAMRSTRKP